MAVGTSPPSVESTLAGRPGRAGKLVEYERYIDEQIRKTRSFVKSVDVAFGVLALVVAVLAFVMAAVLLDHWLVPGGLGFVGRLFCFAILIGGTIFLFARWVAPLVFHSINPLYAANAIEQSRSSFKNSLLNLLLFRQDRAAVPEAVYRSVERQAATVLAEAPIETAVDRSGLIRWGYVLAALVAALGLYKLFSPKDPLVTIERIIAPWADVAAPTRVAIRDVRPGNGTYVAGRRIEVSAEIDGLDDEEPATLYFSTADGQIADRALRMSAASGYRYRAQAPPEGMDLRQDLTYRIEAGDARTPTYELAVEDAPTIVVKAIDYDYPAYTDGVLQDRRDERSGDIKGLEGTQVTVHAEANQDIAAAHIDFDCDGTNDLPMTVKGREASRAFVLRFANRKERKAEHKDYRILFSTKQQKQNEQPVQHTIEVLADLPPEVEIVRPDKDEVLVPENGQQVISVKALDPDFKLDDVRLVLAVEGGKALPAQTLLADKDRPWQGWLAANYRFIPQQNALKAGSVVTFHATARDNRAPQANVSRTRDYRIRIVAPQASEKRANQQPTPADPEGKPDEKKQPNEKPQPQDNKNNDQPQGKSDQTQEPKPGETGKAKPQELKDPKKNGQDKEKSKPNGKDQGDPKKSAEKDPAGGGKPDGKPQPGAEGGEGKADEQRAGEKGKSGSPSDGSKPSGGETIPGEGPADKSEDDASGGGQKSPGGSAGERKADDTEAIDELLNDRQKSNTEEGTSAKTKADGKSDPSAAKTGNAAEKKSVKKESGEKGPSATDDSTEKDQTGEKRTEKSDGQGTSPKKGQTDKGDGGGERPKPNLDETEKTREPTDKSAETQKPGLGDPSRGNTGKAAGNDPDGTPEPQEKAPPRPNNNRDAETDNQPSEEEPKSPSQDKTQSNDSKGEKAGDRRGGAKPGGGQGAPQAGQDTPGTQQSSPSGANKSQEKGQGKTGPKAGEEDKADGPTGKSGDEKGSGSKVKPGDSSTGKGQPAKGEKRPDSKKPDKSKPDQSQRTGESGEKNSDQKGDGRKGDGPGGEGPGGGTAPREKAAPKPPESQPEEPPREDEPNLDHARNATDLALDHLRDRMQKGKEEEILKKLGWSREEADEFLRRWADMKRKADQAGADGADGRRQLEDALKSLGLRTSSTAARTTTAEKDSARGMSTGPRVPPPPEYADRAKAYKSGIGGSRVQGSGVRGQ